MFVSPSASATVGVVTTEPVSNVVKLRYTLRCNENRTTSSGLKIFFTAFTVYTPGGNDFYQLEANLYFRGRTTPAGSYSSNQFGLYDLHGNVFEWCADWYGPYPSGAVTNPVGPATGALRVFRGGGWGDDGGSCRAAKRWAQTPDFISFAMGFRVVLGRP
jgi:formylglycine-generating enzyme required for sulfatase activity